MIDPDDFEAYYDGELALRPFLRAYLRDRWARLRAFVWYRVLRRPRPVPKRAGGAANLSTLAHIYKQAYSTADVADLSERTHPLFSKLTKREP